LTSSPDDETVVVMADSGLRKTLAAYLAGEETNRPFELAYGVVREPPAPSWSHQIVVGRIFTRLERHVTRDGLGQVVQSPIDVVLDRARALVVQPDIVFVAAARQGICKGAIWGAPDLVVEVLSTATARHDRTVKLSWFKQYGVRECWLVDPMSREVEVVECSSTRPSSVFAESGLVRSTVLPELRLRVRDVFENR
jgi:Uma2 family endonuclease